jgi:hypothetical protein
LPEGDPRLQQAPRPAELLAFVRLGLGREISSAWGRRAPVRTARLAPALEDRLSDPAHDPLDAREEEFIRDQAIAAVQEVHALVTSVHARAEVAALLEPVLEGTPVIAEPELGGCETDDVVILKAPGRAAKEVVNV